MRADKAFGAFPEPYPKTDHDLTPRHLAPFLRSRVLQHGTFGVSHTRVPTESRPGHVALIAGLYEDVSAVATGWKLNPVNFDSVFNRSRHTWSWGSPDILPMFDKGATPGRIDAYCYDADFEDYSQDAIQLDLWVFDHVKDFFAAAAQNKTLDAALRQDKVVFFLHLLGIDTTGHFFRPYSKEYLRNIQVVDEGVKEISELFDQFYGDQRTAFVFTADHGMGDWGSHGDGHPDNTRTPLIAWGSGIAKPVVYPESIAPGHDEYSSSWNLNGIERHDVSQADIAALMAHLVGVEFPANSVGELPLSYLDAGIREKAEALLLNAREILEMYNVKEHTKKASQLRYAPYQPLSAAGHTPRERTQAIRALIDEQRFQEAIDQTGMLIKIALQGLRYLQTYDWLFLRALITAGYLGWIAFALTTVVDLHVLQGTTQPSRSVGATTFFSAVLAAFYASFIVSGSPLTYYAYAFFPVVFWKEVFARKDILTKGKQAIFGHVRSRRNVLSLVAGSITYLGVVESLVRQFRGADTLVSRLLTPSPPGTRVHTSRSTNGAFLHRRFLPARSWHSICKEIRRPHGDLVCFVCGNEHIHSPACYAGGEPHFDVRASSKFNEPKYSLTRHRSVIGGLSIVAIGTLYLILGNNTVADSPSACRELNNTSRFLIGTQVSTSLSYTFSH